MDSENKQEREAHHERQTKNPVKARACENTLPQRLAPRYMFPFLATTTTTIDVVGVYFWWENVVRLSHAVAHALFWLL